MRGELGAVDAGDVPLGLKVHDLGQHSWRSAKEMGFDDIHTHGEGDDTVFMPGATHEELLKKLDDSKAYYGMKKKKK